jgi:CubicO group peptidase (beta-lactamase class C family)
MRNLIMSHRFALALALLLTATTAALAAPLPDTEQGRRAAAYLEAFNGGKEEALRAFYQANVAKSALAERPVEQRLSAVQSIREDNGHLIPQQVLEATESLLRVQAKNDHGDLVELDFEFEPASPHMLLGMRMMVGGPGPGAVAASPRSEGRAIADWSAQLDSLSRADAFSGAVVAVRGDSELFRSAYGLASREAKTPNRTDTKFNLGSINKMFTMTAIAQLVDAGKVDLDATIDRYLPDYPKAAASKITVRQLLEHRGGTGDIFGDAYDRADRSKLRKVSDWLPLFRDRPLRFEPGTKQEYSNAGYVLLGAIVERVSGEDYYDYMRRHVYGPLGMKQTDSYASDDNTPNLANGYTRRGLGGGGAEAGWRDNRDSRPMRGSPAGGGYSTLDDLLAFTRAIRSGKLVSAQHAKDFPSLAPGAQPGAMFGGGAPGINAAIALEGPYTIIALANLDPPAAEQAAQTLRAWLPRQAPASGPGTEVRIAAGRPPEKPKRTQVPAAGVDVEMKRSGFQPVISVMVNGQGPFRFAIDTGAGGTLRADSALVAKLGLPVVGQVRGGDPSGKNSLMMDLVEVQSLEIGGARFEGLTAAVRNYNERRMGDPVDGILGFALFSDCLLTLDYPGNRVKLERGSLPAANGRDVLAFDMGRGIPSVKLQVDSLWVDADVDAGSMGGFSLPASYAARLPLAEPPRVVGRARTVSNEFEITAAPLKGAVHLGSYEFNGATISFQPVFPMANVGSQVLRDFAVTFDLKNKRMRLKRSGA